MCMHACLHTCTGTSTKYLQPVCANCSASFILTLSVWNFCTDILKWLRKNVQYFLLISKHTLTGELTEQIFSGNINTCVTHCPCTESELAPYRKRYRVLPWESKHSQVDSGKVWHRQVHMSYIHLGACISLRTKLRGSRSGMQGTWTTWCGAHNRCELIYYILEQSLM